MKKKIEYPVYIDGKYGSGFFDMKISKSEYLYEDGTRKTKITVEDLPEWYIKVYKPHWCINMYIKTKDIKYVFAKTINTNHYRKDDSIYISYNEPFEFDNKYGIESVNKYDAVVYGSAIEQLRRMIKEYSPDVDMTQVDDEFRKKDDYLRKEHPECLPRDYEDNK